MKRQNNDQFTCPTLPAAAAPPFKQPQMGRIPRGFREAMEHFSVKAAENSTLQEPDVTPRKTPAQKGRSSIAKWKSSFQPVGGEDDNTEDDSGSSPKRVELYDPYDPASSDSDHEMPLGRGRGRSSHSQDNHKERRRSPPSRSSWDLPCSDPGSRDLDRVGESHRGVTPPQRPPERRTYSPVRESFPPPGYSSVNPPLDHRVVTPDRHFHSSSIDRFPTAQHRAQRTNGEERIPEYRREIPAAGRLSPPMLQRDYQHQLGRDKITPSTGGIRNTSKTLIMDDDAVTCDLCDVEVANGQELQDHLDSKTHWDTLEHIQQENRYDDQTIAFLQEVLLFKSRESGRAIEDSVLQALQENDHMTKMEIFHCAACNVFLSSSASSVQSHITSQEHLRATKEFQVRQRRTCLDKAETIMKRLRPQFEHFLKVFCNKERFGSFHTRHSTLWLQPSPSQTDGKKSFSM
ncbi:uncharacterized protein V6R79_014084 [Siganus canaliculatus]